LSGAAVIGVFSWPTTEKTIWATKMLWNWSLFLSSFALIGSAHQRLLRHLPESVDEDFGEQKLRVALSLFLQPPVDEEMKPPQDGGKVMRSISRKMLWFWQCPTMLMSFSWVFFLIGYALHLLTPIFDPSQAEISRKVS
jgi:Zn-dependent protease